MQPFWEEVIIGLKATKPLEAVMVVMGIISVWFSRRENSWVYPTGLVNTIILTYTSFKGDLIGEACVNVYYTVMSIYGWWNWSRRTTASTPVVRITFSDKQEWMRQLLFFGVFYAVLFVLLTFLKKAFPGALPAPDAFASATAFTGMWLMARKKVESWWWWMATNIASVPLYYVKGYAFTSVYYVVLLVMAIFGLVEWRRRARLANQPVNLQSA